MMSKSFSKIYLIGFMGSGKSYLSRNLSRLSGFPFVDLDELIIERQKKSINDIFQQFGEAFFRKEEASVLRHTEHWQKTIIACGGGTPCFGDNMDWMNRNGLSIFIDPDMQVLLQRLQLGMDRRPLVKDKSLEEIQAFIETKMKERRPFYEKAHIHFQQKDPSLDAPKALWSLIQSHWKNQSL